MCDIYFVPISSRLYTSSTTYIPQKTTVLLSNFILCVWQNIVWKSTSLAAST